jgi:hypothetical protein
MKANDNQYEAAVNIYEKDGQYAVYDYAKEIGVNEWSLCAACEDETPDCDDGACLVCGSQKEES